MHYNLASRTTKFIFEHRGVTVGRLVRFWPLLTKDRFDDNLSEYDAICSQQVYGRILFCQWLRLYTEELVSYKFKYFGNR